VPASGKAGTSAKAGGVGTQYPSPVRRPLDPSHLASEPSPLPRATAFAPTALPSARPASTSLRNAAPAAIRDSAASVARASNRPGAASGST
jgi:hypothetical protein